MKRRVVVGKIILLFFTAMNAMEVEETSEFPRNVPTLKECSSLSLHLIKNGIPIYAHRVRQDEGELAEACEHIAKKFPGFSKNITDHYQRIIYRENWTYSDRGFLGLWKNVYSRRNFPKLYRLSICPSHEPSDAPQAASNSFSGTDQEEALVKLLDGTNINEQINLTSEEEKTTPYVEYRIPTVRGWVAFLGVWICATPVVNLGWNWLKSKGFDLSLLRSLRSNVQTSVYDLNTL